MPPLSAAEIQAIENESKQTALRSCVPFSNPPEIYSGGGALQTTLVVDYSYNRIGADSVKLRSYKGGLCGPTLRIRSGDKLKIRLINDLPDEPPPPGGHSGEHPAPPCRSR